MRVLADNHIVPNEVRYQAALHPANSGGFFPLNSNQNGSQSNMNRLLIKDRNGRCFIKTQFNGKEYSLTYGTYGNPSDMAYMQMVISIAFERINKGTFTGFDEWRINRIRPIESSDIVSALQERGTEPCKAIIRQIELQEANISSKQSLTRFFARWDVSESSKNRYLSELKRIAPQYCEGLSFSKSKGEPDPFTQLESELILNWIDTNKVDYYPLFLLWFDIGARNGEMAALIPTDFDLECTKVRISKSRMRNGIIKGTKNGKPRTVKLSDRSKLVIHRVLQVSNRESLLFPSLKSESNLIKTVWKPLLHDLNIRYRKLYSIRHTAISRKCLQYQGDIARVAKEGGNSPEVISKHYLGIYEI
jgi:integrase